MRILFPIRPDITGQRLTEYSPAATAVNLGAHLQALGHEVGYVGNVEATSLPPGAVTYGVDRSLKDGQMIAESLLIYREFGWDMIHVHQSVPQTFGHLLNFMTPSDRVIFTLHAPFNIGRSFYYTQNDMNALLANFPHFRLVCVSDNGSYQPLRALYGETTPPGFEKVVIVQNGVRDYGVVPSPMNERLNRFMFVAHMYPSKSIVETLQLSIRYGIPCMYVGRRFPYRAGSQMVTRYEPYARSVEEMIRNNPNLIEHHEVLSNPRVIMEMARSRCVVSLSQIESFGYTPVEAAMVGTPTIWLECQGIDGNMQDGVTGFKIPKKMFKKWDHKIARAADLYNNVLLLDALEIQRVARERFTLQATAMQYSHLYNTLV